MKIAIVVSTFPPYAGGIGNVAFVNARELIKFGHEVTVFTPEYRPVQKEFDGIAVRRIRPLLKYGNAAFVPSLVKHLKGFDIIHFHYPFFGAAEVVWLRSSKLKAQSSKLILHYHMDTVGSGLLKFFFSVHRKFFLPRLVRVANRVLVTSMDYAKQSYLAAYIKKDGQKFIELPNGVDTGRFKPREKDPVLLKRHEIGSAEKVVLFVGGLDKAHYFKGVERLIEAMSRLRQAPYAWKLLIVGEGDLRQQYQSFAHQLRIHPRVIFSGYVNAEQLPAYYNLADVAVLPSVDKSEAFGLVLIEAMACAKPVVASNLAGVRSVVDDGINGLLAEAKKTNDLASKINHLLSHPDVAVRFGQAGRRKVEEQYDWGKIGRKLDGLYKLLNPKSEIRNSKKIQNSQMTKK